MGRFVKPLVVLATFVAALSPAQAQQEHRARVDVQHYDIDAEINPEAQTWPRRLRFSFIPQDVTSSVSFDLNNALNVSRIVDGGRKTSTRIALTAGFQSHTEFSRSSCRKVSRREATFTYDGKLSGQEESPVYGIKFASIQKDHAFLMYPARWFPINEYTTDRYTAELHITVPSGYRVCRGRPGFAPGEQRRKADLYL